MNHSRMGRLLSTVKGNEALVLLCVQVFALHIGLSMVAPILPLYARLFSVSTVMVGFLLTSQAIPRIIISLPAGRFADRVGANRMLAAAAGIASLAALMAGLAGNYAVLLLAMLIKGVGMAISQTAGLTYTANLSTPENRARQLSIYQGSFILGNSVGPAFGGLTAQYFGYRAPFFIYAGLAGLIGLWMLVRLPDSRRSGRKRPGGADQNPGFLQSVRSMMVHPGVVLVSMIGLLAAYTRAGSRSMGTPLLGQAIGFSESQIGLALSVMSLSSVVVLFGAGSLADRYGTKATIIPSFLFSAAGLVVIAAAPDYGLFMLGSVVYGLSAGVGSPIPVAYIANIMSESSQGIALGFYRTFNDLGLLLGPIALGWFGDQSGGVRLGVWVNAGLIVLFALLFSFLAPSDEKRSQPLERSDQSAQA